MRPFDANTEKKTLSLRRDNYDTPDYWIMAHGDHVTIAKQRNGGKSEFMVEIKRRDFYRLISWYMRPQKITNRE